MTRGQKKATPDVEKQLQELSISEESEAECPKCGLAYGEDSSMSSVMHVVRGMT